MIELFLLGLVVVTGILTCVEAYAERDIPWDIGKYFLLFVAGFFFFLTH